MEKKDVPVAIGEQDFEGLLTSRGSGDGRPLVLVFPTVVGRSDADLGVARRLDEAGYRALTCDFYGGGQVARPREECVLLMRTLLGDRAELRRRLLAWLDEGLRQSAGDGRRIAAIGFCFGGLCALDLARAGANVAGVASFHGLFTPLAGLAAEPIKAKVVAFHGWDDPMVPPEQVTALGRELTAAGADWQIHAYGGTMHGFTNPEAASPERGVQYNAAADRRSWASLFQFLEEAFG